MALVRNIDRLENFSDLTCPLPLLKTKQALNQMQVGETLQVTATDSGSLRDFTVFCQQSANTLVDVQQDNSIYIYLIKKG